MKSLVCFLISLVALQVTSSSRWIRRNTGGNFVNINNVATSNANSMAIKV